MLCSDDGIGAVVAELRAVLAKASQDTLLDVVRAKCFDLSAANKRHCVLDLLRAAFRDRSSAQAQAVQRCIRVRAKLLNVALAGMLLLLKSALQYRHELLQEASVYTIESLMQDSVAGRPILRCKWSGEGEDGRDISQAHWWSIVHVKYRPFLPTYLKNDFLRLRQD